MNRNVLWTLGAVGIYWLAWPVIGTDPEGTDTLRNIVALGGIVIAFLNVFRYLPPAWSKYKSGATAGEWRMLMGLELFWLGFGAREVWLMGDRFHTWDAEQSPLNGFFAYWILCAGMLCYSAVNEPIPTGGRQSVFVIVVVAIVSGLVGMLAYRVLWG